MVSECARCLILLLLLLLLLLFIIIWKAGDFSILSIHVYKEKSLHGHNLHHKGKPGNPWQESVDSTKAQTKELGKNGKLKNKSDCRN